MLAVCEEKSLKRVLGQTWVHLVGLWRVSDFIFHLAYYKGEKTVSPFRSSTDKIQAERLCMHKRVVQKTDRETQTRRRDRMTCLLLAHTKLLG